MQMDPEMRALLDKVKVNALTEQDALRLEIAISVLYRELGILNSMITRLLEAYANRLG